nr:tyrosine-type recombinase/integrase [Geminicoccus flavidas]
MLDRNVMPLWRNRPLSDIRKRDVIAIMDAMTDRGVPVQANRVLAYLKRFFRWAAGRDLVETNPAQFVEKPAPETQRERVLDDAELVEVWRAAERLSWPFGGGVQLLMLTAARLREIFNATWDEIDLDGSVVRLSAARSKSGAGREIPLNSPALAALNAMPRFANGKFLITLDGKRPYSGFSHAKAKLDALIQEAREERGVHEPMMSWTLHDLRRTVATGQQRQGARLEVIEAVLGHVSGSRAGIVGTYQRHRFREEARAALNAWGRHVVGLLHRPAQNHEDAAVIVRPLANSDVGTSFSEGG